MNENPVSWKDPAWQQMDAERTTLLRRFGEIQKQAEERCKQEPSGAETRFKERWSRAEILRTLGRRLSEAEGDELRALNAWLQIRVSLSQSRLKGETKE